MAKCRTDCLERQLSRGFMWFGSLVGRYPWVFFIFPMVLSGALGAGFIYLKDMEANDIEDQFTPINGPAKKERAFVQENFTNMEDFSQLRLTTDGIFASLIITGLKQRNILTVEAFTEIIDLDKKVKDIDVGSKFASLCAKTKGGCLTNAVLDIINYKPSNIQSTDFNYPHHESYFIASEIGGVELEAGTSIVSSAEAVRLFYFLSEDNLSENERWLKAFLNTFSNYTGLKTVSVSYFTSISRQEEFETSTASVIPFFSITYFLAITVSITSCLRLDCVRSKVWVATFGVLTAGMAVLSSFGLLLFCGMQFSKTVASSPFLILGIGVDDMFIIISCWQNTKVKDKVETRMAETYKEAAVSITITTLTDFLAFYIGLLTPFRSVQSFCMYTGTAVLFCYFYSITFLGAFLALNGRREQSNRHWLTCMVVPEPKDNTAGNPCCEGGAYNKLTGTEKEMVFNIFFKKYYGPFLMNIWTKVFIFILYGGYLAGSIYGCLQMQEGIDLKNLAVDDSYVVSYYDNEKKYFTEYGPNVMVVMTDNKFQYWNPSAQQSFYRCLDEFKNLSMASKDTPMSWLELYMKYVIEPSVNLNDEKTFKEKLPQFLLSSGFSPDVNFTDNQILASRTFIQTANISSSVDEKNMLNAFRETAEKCRTSEGVNVLVYHFAFIYYDQYAVIVSNTIQNIAVATAVMLVISLLLIPSPLCSLWVTFSIASVIVGVAGFMALWDVNLDSVSMVNLVICIGFSVDFSAHISYAFVSSEEPTANKKVEDALYRLGYPMIQAAVSTIAGVVVLSASESYIFRTFFKIMFMVIMFGVVHGIVFIPVFLSSLGVCGRKHKASDAEDAQKGNENIYVPVYTYTNLALSRGVESIKPYMHGVSNYQNSHWRNQSSRLSTDVYNMQFANKNALPGFSYSASERNYALNPDCP